MNWYCLQVRPQREITVANALGCGVYVPTRWVYIPRRGAQRKQEPLRKAFAMLPGYLFAQAADEASLFASIAALCRVGQGDQGTMREALLNHGEAIEEWRMARAASPRWQSSGVRSVLSVAGEAVCIPQSAIDAIVRLEVSQRFVPAPPMTVILAIGDRVTITLGPNDRKPAVVISKPRQGEVKINMAGEERKVPVSSLRLVA